MPVGHKDGDTGAPSVEDPPGPQGAVTGPIAGAQEMIDIGVESVSGPIVTLGWTVAFIATTGTMPQSWLASP